MLLILYNALINSSKEKIDRRKSTLSRRISGLDFFSANLLILSISPSISLTYSKPLNLSSLSKITSTSNKAGWRSSRSNKKLEYCCYTACNGI